MAYLLTTQKADINGILTKGFPVLFWDNDRIHWLSLNFLIDKYLNHNKNC